MKKIFSINSRSGAWKTAAIVFTLFAAMMVPLYFGDATAAQSSNEALTVLSAPLTGAPISSVTPTGIGRYYTSSEGRSFDVNVSNVNLPANTRLSVMVNDATVGQITLNGFKSGSLHLEGQSAPIVAANSALSVKNGTTTILAGVFVALATPTPSPTVTTTRTPSPSPTGSASPTPTRTPTPVPTPFPTPSLALYAPLEGATIDGVMPGGFGQYAEFTDGRRILNVFVRHIRLASNTSLSVMVGTTTVGQIALHDGEGNLRLDTANGDTVPAIIIGTVLTVKNGAATIVSGAFRAITAPTPNPSPSGSPTPHPSPSGSPTATPTPRPARIFSGRMNGAQVVPPVTTDARGKILVVLNEAQTQISVSAGFFGLSSAQTTATINGPAMVGETAPMIFSLGTIGGTAGHIAPQTFTVTAEQIQQLRSGLWYVQIGSTNHPTGEIRGQIRSFGEHSNFNGSDTEDAAVFRPNTNEWFVQNGSGYDVKVLGGANAKPVSGDYDGDGVTDAAVFRSENDLGVWEIRRSSDGGSTIRQFGLASDVPVRGDYDGDGNNDLTVFRPSTGVWYVWRSGDSGYTIVQFGMNGDIPVASDFDGDGRDDIAVFRPSDGNWYWIRSSNNSVGIAHFGMNGDVPVSGDFDGDGSDDLAVFRPSTGVWYWFGSSLNNFRAIQFGMNGDVPSSGNYDGDGTSDIAVFRPSTGVWYILRSRDNGVEYRYFGTNGDVPATAP